MTKMTHSQSHMVRKIIPNKEVRTIATIYFDRSSEDYSQEMEKWIMSTLTNHKGVRLIKLQDDRVEPSFIIA
jgi:hypothetical protein